MSLCCRRWLLAVVLLVGSIAPAGEHVDAEALPLPPAAIARLGTLRWRVPFSLDDSIQAFAFSPDGKYLAVSTGELIHVLEVPGGRPVAWFPGGPGGAAVFAPDGKTLLTEEPASRQNEDQPPARLLRRRDVRTGDIVHEITAPTSRSPQNHTQFSADGRVAVSDEPGSENTLHIWDPSTGKSLRTLGQKTLPPMSLSPDGRTLAAVSLERRLLLFDATTGKRRHEIVVDTKERKTRIGVGNPAFSPDGRSIAVSVGDSLRVWNVADAAERGTIADCGGPAAFTADGQVLACSDEKRIRLFDAATLRELRRFEEHHDAIRALTFSPDGRVLAAAHRHRVGLWDVATGKEINPPQGHAGPIHSLAFSGDGKAIASGADDGCSIIWDTATAKVRRRLDGHFERVVSMAWSPDGKTLATGDGSLLDTLLREGQIRLWDATAGRLVRRFSGHLGGIQSLTYTPDGKSLLSGGPDARVRFWDPSTGRRLLQVRGADGQKQIAASRDGKLLLIGNLNASQLT